MSVTVRTKDVGDVKDVYKKEAEFKPQLEDLNSEYIKRSMGDWE